jgi:hypothetical protein
MLDVIFKLLKEEPLAAVAAISIMGNVYLMKLVIVFNDKYIGLLKDNANITKQLNIFLQRLQIKSQLHEGEEDGLVKREETRS